MKTICINLKRDFCSMNASATPSGNSRGECKPVAYGWAGAKLLIGTAMEFGAGWLCWISRIRTGRCPLSWFTIALSLGAQLSFAEERDAARELVGPASNENQLADDREEKPDLAGTTDESWNARKAGIKDSTGLDFGVDYNAQGVAATESPGANSVAAGAFRLFGTWDLVDRDGPDTGSLVFKLENRHNFTDVSPSGFAEDIGYVGLLSTVFNDSGWRATHLFWQQRFAQGRAVSYLGFLDVTDYVDLYELANPWTGFSNLAFQNGSGTIGGIPDGAFGAMVGGFLTENIYAVGGIVDANGDATALDDGLETFFDDFETLKTFELGWTQGRERLLLDNAHLTVWQIDERDDAGTSDGWGVSVSLSGVVGKSWLPFLRGGWARDGASFYEAAVSVGFGYSLQPGRDVLGVGLHWSRPNSDTYGEALRDQYTVEAFQLWQVTQRLQVTPNVQLIKDAAQNPDEDFTALFGLRVRYAI